MLQKSNFCDENVIRKHFVRDCRVECELTDDAIVSRKVERCDSVYSKRIIDLRISVRIWKSLSTEIRQKGLNNILFCFYFVFCFVCMIHVWLGARNNQSLPLSVAAGWILAAERYRSRRCIEINLRSEGFTGTATRYGEFRLYVVRSLDNRVFLPILLKHSTCFTPTL